MIINENSKVADALFNKMKEEGSLPDINSKDLLRIVSDICIGALYSWVLTEEDTLVSRVEFYFDFLSNLSVSKI